MYLINLQFREVKMLLFQTQCCNFLLALILQNPLFSTSSSNCVRSAILPAELCCTVIVTKGSYCSVCWHKRDIFLCIGYSFDEQGLLQPKLSQILVHNPNISSSVKSIWYYYMIDYWSQFQMTSQPCFIHNVQDRLLWAVLSLILRFTLGIDTSQSSCTN